MLAFSFITIVAAVAGTSLAAPAVEIMPGTSLTKRAELFKICRNSNFNDCWDSPANLNTCTNAPEGWNDVISSCKTTDPGIQCFIWKDFNCQGDRGGSVTSDDRHRNLADFGWNDVTSSWKCQRI